MKRFASVVAVLLAVGCGPSSETYYVGPTHPMSVHSLNELAKSGPLELTLPDDAPTRQKRVILGDRGDGIVNTIRSDGSEFWIQYGWTNTKMAPTKNADGSVSLPIASASYRIVTWTGDLPIAVRKK